MTLKKEIIHKFPTAPAHATPICQRVTPKHEIVQNKNVIMGCYSQQKATILGTFAFQMPFQGKIELGTSLNSL